MKKKFYQVLEFLGLRQKFEDKSLSNEEFQSIVAEYQKKYQSMLQDDIAAEKAAEKSKGLEEENQKLLNEIYAAIPAGAKENHDGSHPQQQGNASGDGIITAINNLSKQFGELAQRPSEDRPAATATSANILSINGPGTTSKYLFGIEAPMFDMKHRWNVIAANPRAARSLADPDDETAQAFYKTVQRYGHTLQQRYAYLQENGMLNSKLLEKGEFSNNYEGVGNAGVGNQYIILRQDALIARVLKKRDLTQYFPVRYGIQDRDLLFNAYFGELSQAYQKGEIYKGDMKVENEMGYVDDAMIKMQFGPMKELERMYIAYLNRDGSDPIKWSMIEYCILNELETAQVEQNKRRVRGIYVKPVEGVPGSYLNAGTGIVYTLLRYVHDYSIKPHDDAAYRSYTSANMLDAVQEFISDVVTSMSEDADISQHVLYLNERHKPWWIKNIREKYGKDQDFTGPGSLVNKVPDTDVPIRWLPYLGSLPLMLLDIPGNIQFIEYIPGEMLSVKMEEQMEMVRAWSTWKEGCGAAFTGRKFQSREAMDKNGYEWQQIFMNLPAASIKSTVDGKNGFWQITDAGTTASTITDIVNAKTGVAYCIEIGDNTKIVSISKAGKFANITEDWSPSKVGDYIMVTLDNTGNYRELERCVAGNRTINIAVQPNVIGGR